MVEVSEEIHEEASLHSSGAEAAYRGELFEMKAAKTRKLNTSQRALSETQSTAAAAADDADDDDDDKLTPDGEYQILHCWSG